MRYTDPYRAASFDRLHTHNGGLGGDHILPQIKKHIELLGRQYIKRVDEL